MEWLTSDWHLGHRNIISLGGSDQDEEANKLEILENVSLPREFWKVLNK